MEHTNVSTDIHRDTDTRRLTYTNMHACTYTWTPIHTHTDVSIDIYRHTRRTHVHIHTDTHRYTYTQTHPNRHRQTHAQHRYTNTHIESHRDTCTETHTLSAHSSIDTPHSCSSVGIYHFARAPPSTQLLPSSWTAPTPSSGHSSEAILPKESVPHGSKVQTLEPDSLNSNSGYAAC